VETAARIIGRAALENAGQDCTAASRVITIGDVHDEFVERLVAFVSKTHVGEPANPATQLGPVIGSDRREWLIGQIAKATEEGGVVMHGGRPVVRPGFYIEPTVLTNVSREMPITSTELFGPVITVETCASEEEALERANASRFALAAGIWTRSLNRGLRMSAEIDAGKVWVNDHHVEVTEMPHGGRKASGYGSDLSIYAMRSYSAPKSVHMRHSHGSQS
jgi:acyl-CoA reductase-like NAD-dependent aldehyde dehydrogenase